MSTDEQPAGQDDDLAFIARFSRAFGAETVLELLAERLKGKFIPTAPDANGTQNYKYEVQGWIGSGHRVDAQVLPEGNLEFYSRELVAELNEMGGGVAIATGYTHTYEPGELLLLTFFKGDIGAAREWYGHPENLVISGGDEERAWPSLDPAALIGLPGDVVRLFAPVSEADPVALLLSFLVPFGNMVGLRPFTIADGSRHGVNLFAVLVGRTAKARKGTSWARSKSLLEHVDKAWLDSRVKGGLSSGEGLITAVADDPDEDEPEPSNRGRKASKDLLTAVVREIAESERANKAEVDEPVKKDKPKPEKKPKDKRLLVIEEEFGRVLTVGHREGNCLLEVLRQAWDGRNLDNLTKHPMTARSPHISMLGHITLEELKRKVTEAEQFNGFGNRYLYALVTRSQLLPNGGSPDPEALAALVERIRQACQRVNQGDVQNDYITRSPEAEARWAELYDEMAQDDEGGMVGAASARVEAHTMRLSVVYALACGSSVVELEHLTAAWALWRYCRDSLNYIFGDKLGDEVADQLLTELKLVYPRSLDRTDQHEVLGRHVSAARIDVATEMLSRSGLVRATTESTEGRSRQLLTYVPPG